MKLCAVLIVAAAIATVPAVFAAKFTVTTTAESGVGSLRQAILDANLNPGADEIAFNIPGPGPHTIAPLGALPAISNTVTLDGYTQPSSTPNTLADGDNAELRIRLDGMQVTNAFVSGLKFTGASHLVRGLVVVGFFTGITLDSCTGCTVAGNFIGLDLDGLPTPNETYGVDVKNAVPFSRSAFNLIGGTTPAARNVISGNGTGIHIAGTTVDNNAIQGNFIGTDSTGTLPRGNTLTGIFIQSSPTNLIGGGTSAARNLISANGFANSQDGISLLGARGTRILGNYIGTDVTGYYDLGNAGDGIGVQADHVTIGGTAPGAGNVIANNRLTGISIFGCSSNVVEGNIIGTDPSGARPLGNRGHGVEIYSASGQVIGGSGAAGNFIRFSGGAGVMVASGTRNAIRGNSICDNRGLGIDLATAGITSNDPGDADSGANDLQNSPVLTNVTTSGASALIRGYLDSRPSAAFTVDFYANDGLVQTNTTSGRYYLGSTMVATGQDGIAPIHFQIGAPMTAGQFVTATATDATNSTSEFSASIQAQSAPLLVELDIARQGATTTVSWPLTALGFVLESSTIVPTYQWVAVTNSVTVSGDIRSVSFSNISAGASRMFRLHKP